MRFNHTIVGLFLASSAVVISSTAHAITVPGSAAEGSGGNNGCIARSATQAWNICSSNVEVFIPVPNSNVGFNTSVHVAAGGRTENVECQAWHCNANLSACFTSGFTSSSDPVHSQDLNLAGTSIFSSGTNSVTIQCELQPGGALNSVDSF